MRAPKEKPSAPETLLKARQKLERANQQAAAEWWNPTLKRQVSECRAAVARAQKRLLAEGGQMAIALEEVEADHTPEAFKT